MIACENLWSALLAFKKTLISESLAWGFTGKKFTNVNDLANIKRIGFQALLVKDVAIKELEQEDYKKHLLPFEGLTLYTRTDFHSNLISFLKNYWPLSIITQLQNGRPYVFVHSAISLDGYLATLSGNSKWIGNEENLIHSHRLRALFDAVLIGRKTVLADQPALTVRHVEGKNPKRLILSNEGRDFSSLKTLQNVETILLRNIEFGQKEVSSCFDKVLYFSGMTQTERLSDMLARCQQEEVSSILIEGGGTTIGSFIQAGLVDIVQFHYAPLLFGNGISVVQLPKIDTVDEAISLKNMQVTPIGNSFMVTGSVCK